MIDTIERLKKGLKETKNRRLRRFFKAAIETSTQSEEERMAKFKAVLNAYTEGAIDLVRLMVMGSITTSGEVDAELFQAHISIEKRKEEFDRIKQEPKMTSESMAQIKDFLFSQAEAVGV